jgi:hypothetical protein
VIDVTDGECAMRRSQRIRVPRTVMAAIVAGCLAPTLMSVPAFAQSPASSALADVPDVEREIEAMLAATPTDAQLAFASDAELVRLAVRCVPIRGLPYCLHTGWDDQGEGPPFE